MQRICIGICLALSATVAQSDWIKPTAEDYKTVYANGGTVRVQTPVFSQIVEFSYPQGFELVYENTTPEGFYIQGHVLAGETSNDWSQMISMSGSRDLVSRTNMEPEAYLEKIASGFGKACPDSLRVGNKKSQPPRDDQRISQTLLVFLGVEDDIHACSWWTNIRSYKPMTLSISHGISKRGS